MSKIQKSVGNIMGNCSWCNTADSTLEKTTDLLNKRVLFPLPEHINSLQTAFRVYLLQIRLKAQLEILPFQDDLEGVESIVESEIMSLPALSPFTSVIYNEFPPFVYDLPELMGVRKLSARKLRDGSVYVGDWRRGKRTGCGVCYNAGAVMEGYWSDGRLHYKGRVVSADGAWYEGGYYMMQRHGYGKSMSADGQVRYDGEWEADTKHGVGTEVTPLFTYIGSFEHGEKTGRNALFTWPNGDKYQGGMLRGKKHGKGRYEWADGKMYEGNWVEDMIQGWGVLVRKDYTYEGDLVAGLKHGKGLLKWGEGLQYEGEFDQDRMHGLGWFTRPNRPRRLYRFHDNQRGEEVLNYSFAHNNNT